MKKFIIVFFLVSILSCDNKHQDVIKADQIDIEANLKGIENTRQKFMRAVMENDGETISTLITEDVKTIGPGSDAWNDMYIHATNKGPFPYDSIMMFPKETILASDSIAYDFGNSIVYYTNSEGNTIELKNTFLAILKKGEDGIWRLHREVASSNFEN
jgi:ketosteroid isomerase-like protein